jgi:hypothetical protein
MASRAADLDSRRAGKKQTMKLLRLLAIFAAGLALALGGCGSDDNGGGGGGTTNGTTTEEDGYSR